MTALQDVKTMMLDLFKRADATTIQSILKNHGQDIKESSNVNKIFSKLLDLNILNSEKKRPIFYRLSPMTRNMANSVSNIIRNKDFMYIVTSISHSMPTKDKKPYAGNNEKYREDIQITNEILNSFYQICNLSIDSFNGQVSVMEPNINAKKDDAFNTQYYQYQPYLNLEIDITYGDGKNIKNFFAIELITQKSLSYYIGYKGEDKQNLLITPLHNIKKVEESILKMHRSTNTAYNEVSLSKYISNSRKNEEVTVTIEAGTSFVSKLNSLATQKNITIETRRGNYTDKFHTTVTAPYSLLIQIIKVSLDNIILVDANNDNFINEINQYVRVLSNRRFMG